MHRKNVRYTGRLLLFGREGLSVTTGRMQEKRVFKKLIFALHRVNFYDPGAGLAGIILFLPAGIARPSAAENALAELRDRVGCIAEIAHVLGEAVGILYGRLPLFSHHRNLFFQLTEEIG